MLGLRSTFTFSFLTLMFMGTSARADSTPLTAVLPVMAPDLLEPQKQEIEKLVRNVAAESGLTLQSADETNKGFAQAKKVGAGCNIEALPCQAQIGVLIGVKQVLVARVASDWSGDRFELRLLDALRGATIRETSQALPKNQEAALRSRVLNGAVLRVLAPAKTGGIALTAPDGAGLIVDGVPFTPKVKGAAIEGLVAGEHQIELQVDGKVVETKQVVVEIGKNVPLTIGETVTVKDPDPPPQEEPSIAPWIVGGGAALAAVAGLGAGGLQAALEYSAFPDGTRGAMRATGVTLLGATAVGVAIAGVGGAMWAMEGGQ